MSDSLMKKGGREKPREGSDKKYPDIMTQVDKDDEKKPHFLRRILQSPCCRPFIKCFSWKEKYFNEGNSVSFSNSRGVTYDHLIGPQLDIHKVIPGRKTLVLDLDETLVHSSFDPLPIIDIVLPVRIQAFTYKINVVKRPGTEEFLRKMGEIYEVVIFTASLAEYAEPLVKLLDETGVVAHMLYRQHCTPLNGIYVKDLTRIGRLMKDIILVDVYQFFQFQSFKNSPNSFLFQPENAFHIKNFFDDKTDLELYELSTFLEFLANVDDVRPVDGWRKKYLAQSSSIIQEKSELHRKPKFRQESTDSNAPLHSKSFMMIDLRKKSNILQNEDNSDILEDFDLRNYEITKSLRYNKDAEIPAIVKNRTKAESTKLETAADKESENESVGEVYIPSPKESDALIKHSPEPIMVLPEKADELRKTPRGKFVFPDDSNQEPESLDSGKKDSPEAHLHGKNAPVELEDIRYIDSALNPNSPVNKAGGSFIFLKKDDNKIND